MKIFLDDERSPQTMELTQYPLPVYKSTDWQIVRTFWEFCNFIQILHKENRWPELISFDHDLGVPETSDPNQSYEEKSGYDAAKWLVKFCQDHGKALPDFIVHSHNPVGARNIESFLTNFSKFS